MIPKGAYASRELISMLEGIVELNQFEVDDQVTKMNKLKGITEITPNLDELNNSFESQRWETQQRITHLSRDF